MSIEYSGKNEFDHDKYVIKVSNKIIGYIAVDFEMQSIMNLWVNEDMRGKGYGTSLVKHIEDLMVSKGLKYIHTNPINEESVEFFRNVGFTVIDEFGSKKLPTKKLPEEKLNQVK
jgi:N-acetylglutamate synthase-like GNAT family acetyltransferase